jgi:hypothetical protein
LKTLPAHAVGCGVSLTVVALVVAALWATALLVLRPDEGHGVTNSPTALDPTPVDFAFSQQMSLELVRAAGRSLFLDYLHPGFTNATAFSTDAERC